MGIGQTCKRVPGLIILWKDLGVSERVCNRQQGKRMRSIHSNRSSFLIHAILVSHYTVDGMTGAFTGVILRRSEEASVDALHHVTWLFKVKNKVGRVEVNALLR